MKTVYEIVRELEAEPSKNTKLAILKENAINDDLREFFYLALEPTMIYWIKAIPKVEPGLALTSLMDATYDLVNKIASRKYTGHAALEIITDLMKRLSIEDAELFRRIILKDARCGVSEKTVNKVWPGLCTEKLYMRCASFNEKNLGKIKYPALVQLKADGLFMNIIIKKSQNLVNFLSRNMKSISFLGNLEQELLAMDFNGFTGDIIMHGEGLVSDGKGDYEDRKTGNGIISKAIKGTISEEEASRIHLKIWDVMPLDAWKSKKCDFPYETRLRILEQAMPVNEPKLKIIATKKVDNLEEAYDFFNKKLAEGQEGAILKNMDGIWKNHTSPNQVKMKKKERADLLCTGTLPHSKTTVIRGNQVIDSSKWIGSLVLESSDGKIKVNSGSGLTDETRILPPDHYIGKIIEIEYNEIISAKNKEGYSLFLPIIKEVRFDKDDADSYELIKEREIKNTKKR